MGKDSDVYVYSNGIYLICCGCSANFKTGSYSEMLKHLEEHKKYGDRVPKYAIERLKEEKKEYGDII